MVEVLPSTMVDEQAEAENEKPSTKSMYLQSPLFLPIPSLPGQWKCSQTGPGIFHKSLPSSTLSPFQLNDCSPVGSLERGVILALTVLLAFWWSPLFFWVVLQSSCRREKRMPHKLSVWFMLESTSSWSLVWLQIIPQVPLVLYPQGSPFIVLTKQVQMSLPPDSGLLSLDCPFIPGLWNPAETVGSSETLSGRPNAQNSFSFSVWKDQGSRGKPTWSDNWALIFPLNPVLREGRIASPSRVPLRVQSPGGRPSSQTGGHYLVGCQRLCC